MTHTDANNPPKPRENRSLSWLVVNREGKLLAILDSESEAHHYQKGRAHAEGGRYFKAPLDYAAAPQLLSALRALIWQIERDDSIEWEEDSPVAEMLRYAREAIAEATAQPALAEGSR